MSARVEGICDTNLKVEKRRGLPLVLTSALLAVSGEVAAFGFNVRDLREGKWIWEWNPDFDGPFDAWLAGDMVGLNWPGYEGIAVLCRQEGACITTGIRWTSYATVATFSSLVDKIVIAIARNLGAGEVVLLPDEGDSDASNAFNLFFEGAPIKEILEKARANPIGRKYDLSGNQRVG